MKTNFSSTHPQRGSALVTVTMLSLGLMIILAGILGYSLNERRMNYREGMRLEARNAAEAVSEYGLAQVRQLMQSVSDFTSTRFTSNEGALSVPTSSFWGGGNVTGNGTYAPELIIGLVSPITQGSTTALYYYNPSDPDNANDPLKGCYAFRFDIKVISKATVVPPAGGAGGSQTCYMTQTLSSRASPLFSYAVFYNMDMEISPGPTMNIIGAVHANGSLYARKNSSSGTASLNFVGPVTVSGGVYANVAKYPTTNADGSIDNMLSGTDNVNYSTAAGGLVGMKSTAGVWQDQMWGTTTESSTTQASFRTWSSQTFQGNLQSSVHGIQPSNPSGIPPYNPATANPGTPNYDAGNSARSFIVTPLRTSETGNHTMDAGYDANVEAQKYSRKSGLYIVVNPTSTVRVGRKPDGSVTNDDATSFTVPAWSYRVFNKDGVELVLPGQPTYGNGNATSNTAHTNWNGGTAIINIRKAEMTDMRRASFDFLSARSATNPYLPKNITTIDVDITELKKAVDRTVNGLSTSTVYSTVAPNSGTWGSFIYNAAATPAATTITDANLMTDTSQVAASGWNGGIYIYSIDADQQPFQSDNSSANTLYRGLTDPSGVRLINGRGRVASATSATSTRELGLTITTNDALYILGNYNADGTVIPQTAAGTTNDGTSNSGRYYETGEQPCSVASDATTILSAPTYASNSGIITQTSGWNDGLSMLRMSSGNWIAGWRNTAPSGSNVVDGDNNGPAGTGYATGAGYTSVPTVTITGGGASTTATATATVGIGAVTSFTITNPGAGYNSVPTVTFTGGTPTTAATALATISGGVLTGFTITNPGAGYVTPPVVAFIGGSPGTVAVATATIGAITGFTVTNPGAGYTSIPTVSIAGGTPTAAGSGFAWITNGQLSAVTVGALNSPAISFSGGGFTTAATASIAMIVNGQVVDVYPSAGVGYTSAPTIALSGGGATTAATALAEVAGGKVVRIVPNNPGAGYTSAPTVTLTGGGFTTAATAVATILGGKVTEITVLSGAGYSSTPTVTVAATSCVSQATGIAATVSSNKVSALTPTGSIPFVLPYSRDSGLQATSTSRDTKFSGATTEISSAILTGLVVSNKNGVHQAAGGVHNFPRFLESHSGTVAIRGSLVAMYESRVSTEPFSLRVYSPPVRLWGFNELFNQGRFPPLTPTAMSYRRVNFNDITAAQYAASKTSFGL